ncbi:dynein associated protein-domain-containing protein [Cantharellus anzutake]|uniref:dynein associated protein-domain-containing protein n=1 Tax=Cantharellus anzutake TaxID=1750568 RepID=UPI00190676E1|nr:dynein associated protein-domain-containing protein [Cantharellus anzutake]KAF8337534.1 dynein associated protein-domain-containing protein [Cantharellus anzutake]
MPPAAEDIPVGAFVETSTGTGYVRYSGATNFAPGKWVGVELSEPRGKNDGSVQGVRYFECAPLYGVFVRAGRQNSSKLLRYACHSAMSENYMVSNRYIKSPAPSSRASPSRMPDGFPTPTVRNTGKRLSPATSERATSPNKPTASHAPSVPTRLTQSTTAPTLSPPRSGNAIKPPNNLRSSTSRILAPRGRTTPRNSIDLSAAGGSISAALSSDRLVSIPNGTPIKSSPIRAPSSPISRAISEHSPSPMPISQQTSSPKPLSQRPPSPRNVLQHLPPLRPVSQQSPTELLAPPSVSQGLTGSPIFKEPDTLQPPPVSPAVTHSTTHTDDSQELRAKIRVLESKRAADAQTMQSLENRLTEADAFFAVRPRLQAKLQSLTSEVNAYKLEISELKAEVDSLNAKLTEQTDLLEMATLDREMAEEKAENAAAAKEAEVEKRAELEIELEALKQERELAAKPLSGAEDEVGGRTTLDYIQLEKQNARLKEALVKLRDVLHEKEEEYHREITDLTRELGVADEIQSSYEQALTQLEAAENQIDDLKGQLDDALGSEEMVVQLTERNLIMRERMEELRVTVEELEALKELSDEIEENHVAAGKAMQEEIDEKDLQIHNQLRAIETFQESLADYENTIMQFREVVTGLQGELDVARELSQTHRMESQTQANQAAAALTLSKKLQSTAIKNQAKTIDLEIKHLDTAQAREMLSIVQPYLPQAYLDSDRDAAQCYMLFQRLSYKIDLINTLVGQSYNFPESLFGDITDSSLVGVCEMRSIAAHVSSLCKRFAAVLKRCNPEFYLNIGKLYPEVAPMERRLDIHIDTLRRDEFRFLECGSDLQKMVGHFDHLAESYFSGYLFDLGERELSRIVSVEHDLDSFLAAMALTKSYLEGVLNDEGEYFPDANRWCSDQRTEIMIETGDLDPTASMLMPMNSVLDSCKGAKMATRKISKRIDDLIGESAALAESSLMQLASFANATSKAIDFGIQLAQRVNGYITDVRANKTTFQLSSILAAVREISSTAIGAKDSSSWTSVKDLIANLTGDATNFLPVAMEGGQVVKITGEAPWTLRVTEVKAAAAVDLEAQHRVTQLNEELQSLVRAIRARDQALQEATVKIELMERRNETVKKHVDAISELETELAKARKQERAYEEAMEQMQADLDSLEQDYAKLKNSPANAVERPANAVPVNELIEQPVVEGNLETSYLLEQIESLRGAVKFLRSENSYLKGQDLLKEIYALPPLPDLESSYESSSDEESEPERIDSIDVIESDDPPSLRTLNTATKLLYREVLSFNSSPRVVDLSAVNQSPGSWLPQKKSPHYQIWERSIEADKLRERVRNLAAKTSQASFRKPPRVSVRKT